jgi:hypothetical protein
MEELENLTEEEINKTYTKDPNEFIQTESKEWKIGDVSLIMYELTRPLRFNNCLVTVREYVLKCSYASGEERVYHVTMDEGYEFLTHLGKGKKPDCYWDCEYHDYDEIEELTGDQEDKEIYGCSHPLNKEKLCSFEYGVICPLIGEEI